MRPRCIALWGLFSVLVALPAWGTCPPVHRSRAVLRAFQRAHPCPATGKTTGACPGWTKDHVIPLCLGPGFGGVDTVTNMQWQAVAAARGKDRQERALCHAAWSH